MKCLTVEGAGSTSQFETFQFVPTLALESRLTQEEMAQFPWETSFKRLMDRTGIARWASGWPTTLGPGTYATDSYLPPSSFACERLVAALKKHNPEVICDA